MPKFISYAQNFEDVILWRALKDVGPGFYIDVGANDPDMDSVTKAFYERGWRGINIEPIEEWHQRLERQRPRDINLAIAAGSSSGELLIHELEGTGLSTSDTETAERHVKERGYHRKSRTVPVETLNSVCERYHVAPIHFLKIDVEGAEKAVLEGIDLSRIRPWIVLVESTLPNSPIEEYASWEPILLKSRYEYIYFDGLNRYYLSEEHSDLRGHFGTPPNVFDDFVTAHVVFLEGQVREAVAHAEQLNTKAQEWARDLSQKLQAEARRADEFHQRVCTLEARHAELNEKLRRLNGQLAVIHRSLSWRLTVPVRWVGIQYRLVRQHGLRKRLGHLYRRALNMPHAAGVEGLVADTLHFKSLPPLAARMHRRIQAAAKIEPRETP